MRTATLTVEPAPGALSIRLDLPERDTGEPQQRAFRHAIDSATLRALEERVAALFRAGPQARFGEDARRVGLLLHRTLVPEPLRAELRTLRGPLVVASSITGIPWELVHDEEDFWGVRYALGSRRILDRPAARREPEAAHDRPRALVVGADPRGDLPFVAAEVEAVCDALEPVADVVCITDRLATLERVLAHLAEGFDVVHFCGHVVADAQGRPALLLAGDTHLPAAVIEANLVGRPLVFVNGCSSAQATTASIADAFLLGGALAVVGTVADVADEHAAELATTFYREALGGASLGHALREARAVIRDAAPTSPAWLSFVLYGNPAATMRRHVGAPAVARAVVPARAAPAPRPGRLLGAVALVLALVLVARVVYERVAAPARHVAVGVTEVRALGAGVPDWMRTLTRDSVNTVLSRIPAVQVFSRQKIDFLREKRGLTEMEAAEALGMTKLLGAGVGFDGAIVTLQVEIVDITTGVLEDTASVQGPQENLLELETELALRVLTALGVHPSDDELRAIVAERRDATVEAYRLLTETLGGGAPRQPAMPRSTPPSTPGPGASWMSLGTPAYAQAPDQDDTSIRELLRRYAEALESEKPEALAALQLSMDPTQQASLARYFAIADDLRVQIRDVDVLVDAPDAVVTFTREDTFTDAPSHRPMHLEVRVSGRLVKQADGWRIRSLGDRP